MHRLPPVLTHTLQPAQQSQRHSCRHLPTSSITATACSSLFPAVCELWTCERVHAHKTAGQVFRGVVEEGLRPPVPADCPARYASLMQSCWEAEPHNRCGGGVRVSVSVVVVGVQLLCRAAGRRNNTTGAPRVCLCVRVGWLWCVHVATHTHRYSAHAALPVLHPACCNAPPHPPACVACCTCCAGPPSHSSSGSCETNSRRSRCMSGGAAWAQAQGRVTPRGRLHSCRAAAGQEGGT